ncbi:MAG: YigZ family protein [Clostridiales bacterium]|nr:YigZ family protein [Clostridiales bacterium]
MSGYLVPARFGEAEFVEKRSRFIGRVWPVENEEEAVAHIKEMREKHWDATHNVYAYIIREGGAMRYSDDGEPGGTSGMPTLNVFRAGEIFNVCCVVTRYFGGILLGTGGLVRAYSQAAKLALEAAGVSRMDIWESTVTACPYSLYERVRRELEAAGAVIENVDYGADITIEAFLPSGTSGEVNIRLADISAGSVELLVLGQEYRAVEISREEAVE